MYVLIVYLESLCWIENLLLSLDQLCSKDFCEGQNRLFPFAMKWICAHFVSKWICARFLPKKALKDLEDDQIKFCQKQVTWKVKVDVICGHLGNWRVYHWVSCGLLNSILFTQSCHAFWTPNIWGCLLTFTKIAVNVLFTQKELSHSINDGTHGKQFQHTNKLNSVMILVFSKFPVESATEM